MTENCKCANTIEREIWTRSYLCAIDVANPRVAASTADEAVALYQMRWKCQPGVHYKDVTDEQMRYENSVLGARLANCVRYKER